MTSLDQYKVVFHEPEGSCAQCDHSGDVFAFWEQHDMPDDSAPDHEVCVDCLFEMDGRFKNEPPSMVLRKFEEVTSINVTDERVEIGTRSPFGYFFHVHYTSPNLCPVSDVLSEEMEVFEQCLSLSGYSEIFHEDGDGLADHSPYSQLAHRAISREGL